jgi:hypothetical protein
MDVIVFSHKSTDECLPRIYMKHEFSKDFPWIKVNYVQPT